MNLLQRLTKAIIEKKLETVNAMLAALQTLYSQQNFRIIIDLKIAVLVELDDSGNIEIELPTIIALKTDLDIFKSLVNFLKKNSTLEIYKKTFISHMRYVLRNAIALQNLAAVKFLLNEIDCDISKPNEETNKDYSSLLYAARSNLEIFQFLLPYCVEVCQEADDDILKDLLDPLAESLKNTKSYLFNPSDDAGTIEFLSQADNVNSELQLIDCFKCVYAIFSEETPSASTIYTKLGNAFLLNPAFCIEIVGNFLHTLVNAELVNAEMAKNSEEKINNNLLNALNIIIDTIMSMIRNEPEESQNKLQEIFGGQVLPLYLCMASKFKKSNIANYEYYQFLMEHEHLIHESFLQEAEPVTIQIASPDDKEIEKFAPKDEDQSTNLSDSALYELAYIYFNDLTNPLEAFSIWNELAKKGHKESFEKLKDITGNPKFDKWNALYPEAYIKVLDLVGHLYFTGTPTVPREIILAINYWMKLLRYDDHEYNDSPTVTAALKNIEVIIIDPTISIAERALACSELIKFHSKHQYQAETLLKWLDYYLEKLKCSITTHFSPSEISIMVEILCIFKESSSHNQAAFKLWALVESQFAETPTDNIALRKLAQAINKYNIFKEDFNTTADICLKLFTKSISRNPQLDSLNILIITLELLEKGIQEGNQTCLENLNNLMRIYLHSDKNDVRIALHKLSLTLLQNSKTVTLFSSKLLEMTLVNVMLLNENKDVTISPALDDLKNSIQKILVLSAALNNWIANATEFYNKNNSKSSAPQFFAKSYLSTTIAAMCELNNCIQVFLKQGEAELNLKIFLQSDIEENQVIKQFDDIKMIIATFLKNNLQNFSVKENHPLVELTKLLQNINEDTFYHSEQSEGSKLSTNIGFS